MMRSCMVAEIELKSGFVSWFEEIKGAGVDREEGPGEALYTLLAGCVLVKGTPRGEAIMQAEGVERAANSTLSISLTMASDPVLENKRTQKDLKECLANS